MMYLQMLIVIGLCRRALAADGAMEGTLSSVDAPMLDQIIMTMKRLVALVAGELLVAMMLPSMPHIIVFTYELAAAILTGVGLDLLMGIHVVLEVQLANERLGAVFALERFGRAIRMHPRMYLQIPFG